MGRRGTTKRWSGCEGWRRGVRRRRKELLRKKEAKQQELMVSLLNHFRSTVESRVKDVQRRVGAASG